MKRMHKAMRLAVVAAALAFGAAWAAAQTIPGAAARVNGVEITNFRLERHFEDYLKDQRRNLTAMINPRSYKKVKREALDKLIEREVLWQAAQAEGTVAGDEEVSGALAQVREQMKTREAYLRKLSVAGFDERSYFEYTRQDISGAKYMLRRTADVTPPTDDEVAAFYRGNLHRFTKPESAQARHLLARVERNASVAEQESARERAVAWRAQLQAGSDFAELARRSSDDRSAQAGGDLGEVPRGRMTKSFEDALFALQPGQISEVVKTDSGYHVIKMESRTAAATQPLDEVRESIRGRMLAEKRAAKAREVLTELKAAARVEVLVNLD